MWSSSCLLGTPASHTQHIRGKNVVSKMKLSFKVYTLSIDETNKQKKIKYNR